jgi:GNAT superfamily N-acetyltransferase
MTVHNTSRVAFRAASVADIEAEHAVFVAAEGELLARHGFSWPKPPPLEGFIPTQRHILRHDADRSFVAEADGRVVGFAAVLRRGEACYLASLFVEPAVQGMGVGRRLLELAFESAPARRMTITDAIQPVSNALYAKFGLLPMTPILSFRGRSALGTPGDLVPGPPERAALALLDRSAYGFDRAVDHAFWGAEATPTLWSRDGEPVAFSYRWANGRIGPLAGRDATSAADALRAELGRQPDGLVQVPGTARALVEVALAAGLRFVSTPGLLLLSDGVEMPRSLAISGYGLM